MLGKAANGQPALRTREAEGAGAAPRRFDVGACVALHVATNPLELIDADTDRLTLEVTGAKTA